LKAKIGGIPSDKLGKAESKRLARSSSAVRSDPSLFLGVELASELSARDMA